MPFGQPISSRPSAIREPLPLGGYSGYLDQTTYLPKATPTPAGITHGTTTVLARIELPKLGWPVLEDLYLNGDATGSGKLHFYIKSNGVVLHYWWANRYRTVGQDGRPQQIGTPLQPGAVITVECANEDGADDTLQAECDGTVVVYDRPA